MNNSLSWIEIPSRKESTEVRRDQLSNGNGFLVGGFNPSEKYECVSWEYYSLEK